MGQASPASDAPLRLGPSRLKQARTAEEIEQIHRLNYDTFVREVPQHTDDRSGRLVDRFHDLNTYFVATRAGAVVGMVCVNDRPPFSVAGKLADPAAALAPLGERLLEVRLLAVRPAERRGGLLFTALGWMVLRYARAGGYSHLLISGLARRGRLYRRLGFRPLGPEVVSGGASFVPMAMPLKDLTEEVRRTAERLDRRLGGVGLSGR